jgi:site-specific DNA recombinase
MTRCAIYVRVSTKGQEEDGTSLDTQVERCRSYAAERGWDVIAVVRETHTGAELWERPRLTELREQVRAGAVDTVLAYSLDRLSRRDIHLAVLLDEAERYSVRIACVTEDVDTSPVGRMILNVKAFAAELERERTRERTQRGMLARMQGGKLKPGPQPLYGYGWADASHGRYIIDEEKAAVVRRIFEMVVDGYSLREIERTMNDEGIPTPSGRAPRWTYANLPKLLANQSYAGVAIQHRRTHKRVNGTYVNMIRPAEEQIVFPAGTIPPIVTPEVFAAVQARLTRNKQESVRNHQHPEMFLLRGGFIRCGACGKVARSRYREHPDGMPRLWYTVNDPSAHYGCPICNISARVLDAAVWEGIKERLGREDIIAAELARLRENDPTEADRASVERLLAETTRRRDNLTRALADIDDADVRAGILTELILFHDGGDVIAATPFRQYG